MTREAMVEQFLILWPRLLRVAMYLLHHREDAEDAVQNAFLQAWRYCAFIHDESSFQAWIGKITRNEAINLLRKRKREVDAEGCSLQTEQANGDLALRIDMERALNRMSSIYAEAFYWLKIAGYSIRETADKLHCPPGTVGSRLNYARKMLKEELQTK